MSEELKAFKRIQCNYVSIFKARENGKTQLVHDLNTVETALKDKQEYEALYNKYYHAYIKLREEKSKKEQALDIIKENLNIDEILLAVKGVCKTSDYDLVKEVLL